MLSMLTAVATRLGVMVFASLLSLQTAFWDRRLPKREEQGQREKHRLVASRTRPDQESNPQPLDIQEGTPFS